MYWNLRTYLIISILFPKNTYIWSSCWHHITVSSKCISLKLVRQMNILEPVHACQYHCAFKKQAIPPPVCLKKIWFSRKSRRACASQSSARCAKHKKLPRWHRIVQSTKLFKAQNCVKHKIVQSTKLCKEQNCAKHKSAQSTNMCKAQNCSKRACNTWTLVVCRLELFLLCNLKRLCNSSRLRGSFAMDPLLEVQFSENSGGSSGESMFNAGAVVAVSMPGAATSTLSPNPLPITYLHLFSLTLPPWIHF